MYGEYDTRLHSDHDSQNFLCRAAQCSQPTLCNSPFINPAYRPEVAMYRVRILKATKQGRNATYHATRLFMNCPPAKPIVTMSESPTYTNLSNSLHCVCVSTFLLLSLHYKAFLIRPKVLQNI